MIPVTSHKSDPDKITAHALRRYVTARAAGRPAPEYVRHDMLDGIPVWAGCSSVEAEGRCDGKRFRQVCRHGLPWCPWLGTDTSIASDHALQAFFELHATEPHDWARLLKEVSRCRVRALREWRRKGQEILARVQSARQDVAATHPAVPTLAAEFAQPGQGLRSLMRGGR